MKCKISAVFAALFLAVILTSCGSKGKNIVPVELWYGATFSEAGEPPADWEVFNIIRRKLNIELKISAVPASSAEAEKKITAAAEAGRLPDIFVVGGTVLPKLMKKECLSYVDDMYELMPTRTSQMYDVKERKSYGYKGKHYALSQPGSVVKNEGILIRKDWLDKLGLEIPVTLDDYMNVMKAFTYNDPDGNGKNDTYGYGAYLEIKKNSEGLGVKFDPIFGAFGVEGTFDFNKLKAIVKTQPDAKLTFSSDDEIIQFINGLLMKVHILKKPADSYHTEEYNEIKYCSYKPTSAPLKTIGEANGVSSVSVPPNIEINDEDLPF